MKKTPGSNPSFRIELAKTLSGHWYAVWKAKKFLGYFPSSTTILNAYPQSEYLTKWIADQGYHESQRIKSEAGERGTRIHTACDLLESGETLVEGSYSTEEWYKINAFVNWHKEYKPILIEKELSLFSPKHKYAGRADRIYLITNKLTVLDFKSSGSVHDHFPLQFSSYANAIQETMGEEINQTACLHLGAKNKNGYRFIEYPNWHEHFKVFLSVQKTWQYDYFDSKKNPKEPPVISP